MNGWWWDPGAPGRGFFIEYADAAFRVACCIYADDGKPAVHSIGPVAPTVDGDISTDDFKLVFKDRDRARVEWRSERFELKHQHAQLREDSLTWDSPMSGWWMEEGASNPRAFICEQLGRRVFAALLSGTEWLLFEAKADASGTFRGAWRRYSNGQALGAP